MISTHFLHRSIKQYHQYAPCFTSQMFAALMISPELKHSVKEHFEAGKEKKTEREETALHNKLCCWPEMSNRCTQILLALEVLVI